MAAMIWFHTLARRYRDSLCGFGQFSANLFQGSAGGMNAC
jgi:hypothetical protein